MRALLRDSSTLELEGARDPTSNLPSGAVRVSCLVQGHLDTRQMIAGGNNVYESIRGISF